eukprot:124989-Amphidinium_carterae.1
MVGRNAQNCWCSRFHTNVGRNLFPLRLLCTSCSRTQGLVVSELFGATFADLSASAEFAWVAIHDSDAWTGSWNLRIWGIWALAAQDLRTVLDGLAGVQEDELIQLDVQWIPEDPRTTAHQKVLSTRGSGFEFMEPSRAEKSKEVPRNSGESGG